MKKTKANKNRYFFLNLITIIIFKILGEYIYIKYLNPIDFYLGFELSINLHKLIISYISIILIYFIIPKENGGVYFLFIQTFYVFMIIPLSSIFYLKNESYIYTFVVLFVFILMTIKARFFKTKKIFVIFSREKDYIELNLKILNLFISLFTLLNLLYLIKLNGIPSFEAFNFSKIYLLRANVKYSGILNYTISWCAKTLIPFGMILSLEEKNRTNFFIYIIFQLMLFLSTSHKSYIFIPIFVIIIFYLFKKEKNYLMYLVLGLTLYMTLALIIANIFPYNHLFFALFPGRVIFTPAIIQYNYYDFFSSNSLVYFSEGLIGKMMGTTNIYNTNIANMIGDIVYSRPNMMVNTNFISDAYYNIGFIGVGFVTLLLNIILTFIDRITSEEYEYVFNSIIIINLISLNDTSIFTNLLTGGFFINILLIVFYSININNKQYFERRRHEYTINKPKKTI